MPRMSKQKKEEWDFFLDENGRITYNELCRKCDVNGKIRMYKKGKIKMYSFS